MQQAADFHERLRTAARGGTLAQHPAFTALGAEAIAELDRACRFCRIGARHAVIDYQDQGTKVFFVLRGQVRVIVASAGKEAILRDIHDGGLFGELAAIDRKPRSASIVAINDSDLAIMPDDVFRSALHRHPTVCDHVLNMLVGKIRTLANRAAELASLDMRHRLYAELLRLARRAPLAGETLIITPPPTHAELAGRVTSRREAVTRELKLLERGGLIARRRGAIVLLDPEALRLAVAAASDL